MSESTRTILEKVTSKPGLGWLLMASLGVNLFLGGFMAARMYSAPAGPAPSTQLEFFTRGIPPELPPEAREELEDSIRVHRRELRRTLREYRQTQAEIRALLAAEEFDEEALDKAYQQLRELSTRIQGPIHEAVIEAVRGLDAANRQVIIEMQTGPDEEYRLRRPGRLDGQRWRFERDGQGFLFRMREVEAEEQMLRADQMRRRAEELQRRAEELESRLEKRDNDAGGSEDTGDDD